MRLGERWLEASFRNRESRLRVNALSDCHVTYPCKDVCIELRPNGWKACRPKPTYDHCGNEIIKQCPDKFMRVCAEYIDDNGLHVFVWPTHVMSAKQGFYVGAVIVNNCDEIARIPVRVGAHPGAHYAEGPVHTPLADCVTCDDYNPCMDQNGHSDCGCSGSQHNTTNEGYMPQGMNHGV